MSAIKFKVGEPRTLTLAFDEPKRGTNQYGAWYMYGVKNGDLSSDEDCFFATASLHTMIRTLGAGEGDKIDIEKCSDGEISFFKVNGLTMKDMNSGGSAEKIEEVKPKIDNELESLRAENVSLRTELATLKANQVTDADIPF